MNLKWFTGISLILSFLILLLFTPTIKANQYEGTPCAEGSTCWNFGSNYCYGNSVRNDASAGVCNNWRSPPSCDFSACTVYSNWSHIDNCECGCSNDACNSGACSNPPGNNGDTRYDCSPASASNCASDACVGLPQQCQCGTWVTTNTYGECTTACNNCSHATATSTPTPPPGATSTPTPPPGATATPVPAPGCNTITLSASPSTVNTNSSINFSIQGDGSTFPGDNFDGATCSGWSWGGNPFGATTTCTTDTSGRTHTWTHTWKHSNDGGATWSGTCTASTSYVVNNPTPTGWITTGLNPCNIATGATTCSVNITWGSSNTTTGAICYNNGSGNQLFGSTPSGSQTATGISSTATTTFTLYKSPAGCTGTGCCTGTVLATKSVNANAPPPPAPTVTKLVTCLDGPVTSPSEIVNISWPTSTIAPIAYIDISPDNFASILYNRGPFTVANTSAKAPNLFAKFPGGTPLLTIDAGITYSVRAFNGSPQNGGHNVNPPANPTFSFVRCPINGAWSAWGNCSTTCGGGTQTRTCSTPLYGGADCSLLDGGNATQPCPSPSPCPAFMRINGDVHVNR